MKFTTVAENESLAVLINDNSVPLGICYVAGWLYSSLYPCFVSRRTKVRNVCEEYTVGGLSAFYWRQSMVNQ